jgi:hypothetical protein
MRIYTGIAPNRIEKDLNWKIRSSSENQHSFAYSYQVVLVTYSHLSDLGWYSAEMDIASSGH